MIKAVFSDFDGTLTEGEEFSPLFFETLNFLKSKNIPLVIVTGRSISWAHFLLSHISYLNMVIAEGGGVIAYRDKKGHISHEFMVEEIDIRRLIAFCDQLDARYSDLPLTVDSIGRVTDRAIELYNYENYSKKSEIDELLEREKINHSCSNVHLNFWCGHISKYKTSAHVIDNYIEASHNECIFFGDSLNDESMFESFENSVGVSNISRVIKDLKHHPKVILEGEENAGIKGVLNYLQNNL